MLDDNRGLAMVHFEKRPNGQLVEIIRMQALPADCWVCGGDATGMHHGIPVYEDQILPNDWPGDWAGVPACEGCFEKQNRLTEPVALWRFKRMK
jgi:hypothetical protein